MHCSMCSEENPCPDCLIEEVRYQMRGPVYATQGGGYAIPEGSFQDVFLIVPEWGNFKVGDVVPKEWDMIKVAQTIKEFNQKILKKS